MRSRIPIALVLAALVASGCNQNAPSEVQDSASDVPLVLTKTDGTNNGAARWIPDPNCGVFDGDGNVVWTGCKNQIATYSSNDNAVVTVKASNVPNSTGKVVVWDAYNAPDWLADLWGLEEPPIPCVLVDTNYELTLFTVKWSGRITPSGQATFVCHYMKKWEWEPPPGWESPF